MIIDWHTHIAAPRMREAGIVEGNWPGTIENVLRLHDEVGLDWSVIWSPSHYLRSMELGDCHTALVASNRDFAKLRDAHGDKILFFATTVPGGGEDFLREVERTVTEDDARGVVINSSHRGAYPDDPEALAFFELAQSLDIPVIVHPPAVGFGEERMDNYSLASSIGRPFDNCLAVGRLIVMGILEKFPDLKLVASQLGGGISEIIGRMDYAYEMRDDDTVLGRYAPCTSPNRSANILK